MLQSYLSQRHADNRGVRLLAAVIAAGIPDSTYYRWKNRKAELRFDTSDKVRQLIEDVTEEVSAAY
jgi:hypothetical protein